MSRVLLVTVSSLSILASQFWFSAASAVPRVDGQAASTEAVSICKSGDCDKELSELERLARKGSGDAAAVVALAYASGDGVEQDFGKAKEFIEHGVRKRNPLAMFVMADWYARGFVLPQNTEQAQLWLDRAAEKAMHQPNMIKPLSYWAVLIMPNNYRHYRCYKQLPRQI